jgi:hypothetical protein
MVLSRNACLISIVAASQFGLLMVMRPDFVTTAVARMHCEGPTYSFVRLVDPGSRVRFAMVNVRDDDMAGLLRVRSADASAAPSFATRVAGSAAGALMALMEPADAGVPDWLRADHPNLRRVVNVGCVAELAALGGPIGLIRRLEPGTPHRVAISSVVQRPAAADVVPVGFSPTAAAAEPASLGPVDAATVAVAGLLLDIGAVAAACLLFGRGRRQGSLAAA